MLMNMPSKLDSSILASKLLLESKMLQYSDTTGAFFVPFLSPLFLTATLQLVCPLTQPTFAWLQVTQVSNSINNMNYYFLF